jgi:hypothetical protein
MSHLKGLTRKPEEKESLEGPKCKWEYVKINLTQTGCGLGSCVFRQGPVAESC